jgi:hypothetical protein
MGDDEPLQFDHLHPLGATYTRVIIALGDWLNGKGVTAIEGARDVASGAALDYIAHMFFGVGPSDSFGTSNLAVVSKVCHSKIEGDPFNTYSITYNFLTFLHYGVPSNFAVEMQAKALVSQRVIRSMVAALPQANLTTMVISELPNLGAPVSPVKAAERITAAEQNDAHLSASFNRVNEVAALDFALPIGPVSGSPHEVAAMQHTWLQLRDTMNWRKGRSMFASASHRLQNAVRFRGAMNEHLNKYGLNCREETAAYAQYKGRAKFQDWLTKNRKSIPA